MIMTNVISRVTFRIFAMSKNLACFGVEIKSIMYFTYIGLPLYSRIVKYYIYGLSCTGFGERVAQLNPPHLERCYRLPDRKLATVRHAIQVLHKMRLVVSLE
jgi:hypothetical protein